MSYPEGSDEKALQDAEHDLSAAVERVARLSGSVPDGYYMQDWAVVGAAAQAEGQRKIVMFAIPGTPMVTYQLHGLLDLADKWIVLSDDYDYAAEDDEDDEDV